MTDPRRPRPSRPPGDTPLPDPGPVRPPPGPGLPPAPWTPFGPGDTATPDVDRILRVAQKTLAELAAEQVKVTGMRDGPGPDNTPPVVVESSRADGPWPYLLIRWDVGDTGARPLEAGIRADMDGGDFWSPDILLTDARPPGTPTVIDRDDFPAFQPSIVFGVSWGSRYDIWAHVWNLGRVPATGVRVRAFLPEVDVFLGGSQVDLGDRLSPECHRIVKVATYTAGASGESVVAPVTVVAECLTDPATGDRARGMDRHCAHSWLYFN